MRINVIVLFRRCFLMLALCAGSAAPAFAAASPGLDVLLGGSGRADLQAELKKLVFKNGNH